MYLDNDTRNRISEILRKYNTSNIHRINERNEKAIYEIMKEFQVSHEKAVYMFLHYKD